MKQNTQSSDSLIGFLQTVDKLGIPIEIGAFGHDDRNQKNVSNRLLHVGLEEQLLFSSMHKNSFQR
jgi:hypothetical protein